MKTPISSGAKVGFRFTGIVLFSVAVGVGAARAETFQHGGSTATIEQSGGSGASGSQITRYKDGQKIVTEDGSSTDITIQRSGRYEPSDTIWEYPQSGADRFQQRAIEERFSGRELDDGSGVDCADWEPSSAREELKRRMLDRFRSGFLP